MKDLYLRRTFDINPSGGKKIELGLLVRAGKCVPAIVVVGEKASIQLDVAAWHTLMDKKGLVDDFFAHRTNTLTINLDSEQHMTTLSARPGELHLVCFYQTPMGNDTLKFMHLAQITMDKLFAIRRLVEHYFELLEKSIPDVEEFIAFYNVHRSQGTTMNNEVKVSASGVSLSLLHHELECYSHNFYY